MSNLYSATCNRWVFIFFCSGASVNTFQAAEGEQQQQQQNKGGCCELSGCVLLTDGTVCWVLFRRGLCSLRWARHTQKIVWIQSRFRTAWVFFIHHCKSKLKWSTYDDTVAVAASLWLAHSAGAAVAQACNEMGTVNVWKVLCCVCVRLFLCVYSDNQLPLGSLCDVTVDTNASQVPACDRRRRA